MFRLRLIDSAVLHPTTQPIRMLGITARSIQASNGTLQIWTARSRPAQDAEPQAFILEFTGNATRAEEVAQDTAWTWNAHAVEVWAVNYPGYGGSTGPSRMKSIAATSNEAYDALRATAGNRPIFVVGTSLGTTAALHVAAERPVAGLMLINPPALRQVIRGEYGWWNLWLLATPASWCVPSELDSLANAPRVTVPAVCMVSHRDTVVPYPYQRRVVDAYAGPKRVIELDANHNDPWTTSTQRQLAQELTWLWQQAGLPTTQPTVEP